MSRRHRPVVEELEPRILFSADLATLTGAHLLDTAEVRQIAPTNNANLSNLAESSQIQVARREIVFVDTSVDHWETLVSDIEAAAGKNKLDVVLIDASRDGIDQISATLASRDDLDAIHIISHGSAGTLQLGTTQLDGAMLTTRAAQIQGWQTGLNGNADLLLYGCDVASSADGQAFVARLGALTGADVAASSDKTGNAAQGGNWQFEYKFGSIETQSVAGTTEPTQWAGTLAITSNGTVTSTQTTGATSLTWSHTVSAGSNRVLVVELALDGLGAPASSVTYGGVALTQIGRGTGNHAVELWALINPTVGTANVVASFSGTTAAAGGASTFNGVAQTIGTAFGTFVSATGTGTTASVTASSAAGEQVIDVLYWRNSPATSATPGAGQTSYWSQTNSTMGGGATLEAGAASVVMSSNLSGSVQWEIAAVSMKTAAGITVTPTSGLTTTEAGGTATFNVVLDKAPTANVTIALSSSDSSEGTLSTSSLTFTTANWSTPQTVTVTGVDDSFIDGNIAYSVITAAASSADASYNGLNASDISLSNTDNDTINTLYVDTASDTLDGTVTSIASLMANKGADGKISLREAITAANNTANGSGGADVIAFNIAGGGVQTITLGATALPGITNAVVIDGWTQPGYAGTPLIVINGINAPNSADGLSITAGGSTVRGLVIENFGHYGIYMSTGGGNLIEGNYIGTNAGGTAAAANGFGIVIASSANNTIGGTTAASRNLISGNNFDGINVSGAGATGNLILGNYIGTNATGTGAIANSGLGIALASANNTVGGTSAGSRNIISGNGLSGVEITSASATGNTVAGNYIGVNAAGTAAIANGETGVMIDTGASGNTIGGATASSRNVISGNTQYGVIVSAQAGATTNNIIQGNYLGTNAAGTAAVSNGGFGVVIDYAASNTSILNNVISGNTNTSWSASRGGIYLYANGATIQGNIIGLDATGTVTLGNGGGASTAGIFEAGGSSNVLIGGTGASQGNTIAGNTGAGVAVLADPGNIQMLGNSIYGNTGLGIDLGNNGVTTNDAGDADSGANNLQNFPALIGATTNGSTIVIAGSLNSTASSYYRIEFFSSPLADATGYGEGRTYLGYANVNTNGSGNATFNTTLSVSVAAGQYVSATATKANASYTTFTDTSEFAQNVTAVAPNNAPSGTNKTQTILEDASHIFSTADFGFSDPSDSPAKNLLAVKISTLPTAGSLTLSGAAVTAGQTITAADIAASKLVFMPVANANGAAYASFTFQVQDDGGTSNGGVDLDPTPNTFTFNVTAVNDAPILADTALSLTVAEDAGVPSGVVGSLLSAFTGGISDVDSGAVNGIALVASNETNGSWYYTTNGGTNWTTVGTVNATSSLLLANNASTRLYFSPAANYNGSSTSALTLRAWDQTSGTAGAKVDTSTSGGTTAFSSATDVVDVSVTAVNDPPVNSVPGAQSTNEDTAKVFSAANSNAISITDIDAGGTNNQVTLSVTNGTLTLAGTGGLTFVSGDGTSDATMTFRGTASAINTALNGLSYSPTANYNGNATLTLATKDAVLLSLDIDTSLLGHYTFDSAFLGNDSSPAAGNMAAVVGATSVVDGTRGKVVSLDGTANSNLQITGTFGAPANVTIAAWVNLTAADTSGAEVISLGDNVLLRLDAGGAMIGGYYNGITWVGTSYNTVLAGTGWHHVAFSFNDTANATALYLDGTLVAQISTADSISYTQGTTTFIGTHGNGQPNFNFQGLIDEARVYNRALSAIEIATLASDMTMTDTDTVAVSITPVNDAPFFSNLNGTPTYTENAAAVVLDADVTITDAELSAANNFNGATLTLTRNGGTNAQDLFSATGTLGALTQGGSLIVGGTTIGAVTTNSNGTLLLAFNANATNALVNSAMQQIAYSNSSDSPPTSAQINWTFSDGNTGSQGAGGILSVTGSTTVAITAVNDLPITTTSGSALAYTENQVATAVDPGFTVSDVDNANLASATVSITAGFASGQDTLAFSNQNGITGNWNSSTGVLTLSGSATLANYQAALRSVTYVNTSEAPSTSTRTVSFVANDGTDNSAAATRNITITAVNDAPILADTALSLTVAEDAGVPSGAVGSLLSAFTGGISDVDSGAVNGIALVTNNKTNNN